MNPTPEQVVQWAREAGIPIGPLDDDYCKAVGLPLGTMCNVDGIGMEEVTRLVTRAMAEQAEADAKLCRSEADRALFNWKSDLPSNQPFWNGAEQMAANLAAAIRANAPKVTT